VITLEQKRIRRKMLKVMDEYNKEAVPATKFRSEYKRGLMVQDSQCNDEIQV